ncbi:uncharacterized protein LOC118732488 [Rhagoletis pomonella]|uniref:uncharacterized protein LOC118732488 n=1 Tax=Rhagoletis pomonella TaxID=28610 RepID=UPI00177B053F|nr:uncharacterized protein LOC118732488 [Rhagoletis pomonella]
MWICQRCMDFYCSPECQRKDWQRHRYICFAMPGLISACINSDHGEAPAKHLDNEKLDKFSTGALPQSEGIGSGSECKGIDTVKEHKTFEPVTILGFISSNICFVRLVKDTEAHLTTLKKIDAIGREAPLLDIFPSAHTLALTLYNGMFSRVEVLSFPDQKHAKVLHCDYGVVATIEISDLRVAAGDILKLPRFSMMVKLHNVNEYSPTETLTSFLNQFEGIECQMRYCVLPVGEDEVELAILGSRRNINEEVVKFCSKIALTNSLRSNHKTIEKEVGQHENEIPTEAGKADMLLDLNHNSPYQSAVQMAISTNCGENFGDKPIISPPFEIYVFKSDLINFKVVVLDTSALNYGYIGCIAETDLKYLVKVQEYLSRYKDNKQYYSPKLHEYCLARFENEWYRARAVKVNDNARYTVVYLDFTNESVLTSKDIRRYPVDLNGACRTNLCLIDGLPTSLKNEHVNFLKKEITTESKLLIDRVKEIVQQIVVVECQHIIKKMLNLGLI